MKRLSIFLCALLATCSLARAQYFFHHYGTVGFEEVFSGEVCDINGPGHVMSGMTSNPSTQVFAPTLIRTDENGVFPGATHFSNYYDLWQNQTHTMPMRARENFAVELPDGKYAMAGAMYKDNTFMKMAVWYTEVDLNGNPLTSWWNILGLDYNLSYWESKSWHDYYQVEALELDPNNPDHLYILGYQQDQVTFKNQIFVIKVDRVSHQEIWAHSYDVPNGGGFGVSPQGLHINPSTGDIVVVGAVFNGMNNDALMLTLNAAGIPVASETFGAGGSTDIFYSLIQSVPNPNLYYIVGATDRPNGDLDFWVMEYDWTTNTVNNSKAFDYLSVSTSGADDQAFDIFERYSNTFGWEYFVLGQTSLGIQGLSDIFYYRLDASLTPAYGNSYATLNGDYSPEFDQDNSGGGALPDGISMYGLTHEPSITFSGTTAADQVIHKVYFNGEYGCPYTPVHWTEYSGPVSLGPTLNTIGDYFSWTPGLLELGGTLLEDNVCFDGSLPGGQFDKMAPPSDHLTVSSTGEGILSVSLSQQEACEVKLELVSLNGQVLSATTLTKPAGNWQGDFAIPSAKVAAGMYLVRATSNGAVQTERVLIQ